MSVSAERFRTWGSTVAGLWKLGNSLGFLIVQWAVLLLLATDFYRSNSFHISSFTALRLVLEDPPAAMLGLLVIAVIVAPLALGAVRAMIGDREWFGAWVGRRGSRVRLANLVSTAAVAYLFGAVLWLQVLAGNQGWDVSQGSSFFALSAFFMVPLAKLGAQWPGWVVTAILLPLAYKLLTQASTPPPWVKDFPDRVLLANLDGPLYPSPGRGKLWFNASAIAPEIRLVRQESDRLFAQYQELMPGSLSSGEHLVEMGHRVRSQLRTLFLGEEWSDARLEFYSSTSRALEVSINRLPKDVAVVVSPFEHPTERKVAEWVQRSTGRRVEILNWGARAVGKPWHEQLDRLKTDLANIKGSFALLASEVSFLTGLRLPLRELQEIVERRGSTLLIDGAHGIANGTPQDGPISMSSTYVFSAHKWLLSPDPCGIVVCHAKDQPLAAYDTWYDRLPASTVSARQMCSFAGAVKVWGRFLPQTLHRRAAKVKENFLERMGPELAVFGKDVGLMSTFIVAVRPSDGYRWVVDSGELRKVLAEGDTGIQLLPIAVDLKCGAIVRVSFPYFLELRSVTLLAQKLKGLVMPVDA